MSGRYTTLHTVMWNNVNLKKIQKFWNETKTDVRYVIQNSLTIVQPFFHHMLWPQWGTGKGRRQCWPNSATRSRMCDALLWFCWSMITWPPQLCLYDYYRLWWSYDYEKYYLSSFSTSILDHAPIIHFCKQEALLKNQRYFSLSTYWAVLSTNT